MAGPLGSYPSVIGRSSDVRGRRVLVTGASGFVGTWLTEHLVDAGADVTVVLADFNPKTPFVASGLIHRVRNLIGSVEDFTFLKKAIGNHGIDSVFHLAAVAIESRALQSPRSAFEINIRGTYNVLEACRVHASTVRSVIVASSDKAYGDNPTLPYIENLPLHGRHPYDVSKSCADLIAQSYARSFGLPVVIGRFGNIYGAGDLNWSRLIPGTIRRLLQGEAPIVRRHATGDFHRDFLYAGDCVRAYLAMLEATENPELFGEAFNFAMGGTWAIPEVVGELQELLGLGHVEPNMVLSDHPEIPFQHVCVEKAARLLGWFPRTSLTAGLSETVMWYRSWIDGSGTVTGRRPAVDAA
jgi:CDP-glucose 4,6-dehydratase